MKILKDHYLSHGATRPQTVLIDAADAFHRRGFFRSDRYGYLQDWWVAEAEEVAFEYMACADRDGHRWLKYAFASAWEQSER